MKRHGHGGPGGPGGDERRRHGGGRVVAYFLVMILLNVLLAVYALYMLGTALEYDWAALQSGDAKVIAEAAFQLLLVFSPVILTILLNRLLYRGFRGYGRFPHGTALLALLAVLIVQAATILLILKGGFVEGVDGFRIDTLTDLNLPLG